MNRTKWLGPLLAAIGGLVAALVGDNPIGWAVLAGTCLLFVVGNLGKRIIGVLLVLVSLLAGWLALGLDPVNPWGVVGSGLGLVGAVLVVLTAYSWAARRSRFERGGESVDHRAPALEVWKAMDEGHDPTAAEER
ncbi:Trp biosynthesis-associated membrane protein [Propionibacteriaceae bacterium Y1923]|uniref:Trp biosynthesis-associated membrane protein n=1 Tax=Aestuariimicrobium sp. Y1814 TaxID=3418742 RepID=UPI003C1FFE56